MFKAIALFLFVILAGQASAQSCPEFFRFVDFGLKANDGIIYRGGPIFRAESLEGQPLLLRERTDCRKVPQIAKDGHGNPIPVVTRVFYNPERTGLALDELRLTTSENVADMAEEQAEAHRMELGKSSIVSTQGADFLCVFSDSTDDLSCQLQSPYAGSIPLIVTCDADVCTMPVLAITDQIFASAVWTIEAAILAAPETAGAAISRMIRDIHGFLDPLSSTT